MIKTRSLGFKIKQHAGSVLQQKISLLKQISDKDYKTVIDSTAVLSSTVGAHLRHSLEHYEEVILKNDKYVPNATTSSISRTIRILKYDQRTRNSEIEQCRFRAIESCKQLLASMDNLDVDTVVEVEFMGDTLGSSYIIQSNIARELSFVAHHGVHHLASAKLIMEKLGYVINDTSIGIANSTVLNFVSKS